MRGVDVSVDPVTATLPVVPGRVHSGVPPLAGAAVGHVLAAIGASGTGEEASGSVTEDVLASAAEDVVADEVSASEPQAASVMTSEAAAATSAIEDVRKGFTVATLQPQWRWISLPSGLSDMGTKPLQGHLPINGLDLYYEYYEVYGELGASKPPLLLIPGAFMATGSMRVWPRPSHASAP